MPTAAYELGKTQHAEGKTLDQNPYTADTPDHTDWTNGFSDAATAAGGDTQPTENPTAGESPGAPGSAAPAGTPNAEGAPTTTEVVASLGDAGYERIMDLLTNPPIDGIAPGALPENGEVPDDLGAWLEAWKAPLAFVAVDTAIGAVKTRISGNSRGRLKELYRGMAPAAMAAAMQANADTVAGFADQRVAEAGLITSMQTMVTQKAAGYLLNALLLV